MPPRKSKGRLARPPKRARLSKGCLVRMESEEWKHGPGKVIKFPDPGTALVKWPRRASPVRHTIRYLVRVNEDGTDFSMRGRK